MAEHEDPVLNQPTNQATQVPERSVGPQRWLLSWWWVWIPFIVVVTLWIGGWWFGNYGGPWSAHPQPREPQITDPVVAIATPGFAQSRTRERELGSAPGL
jgi:hypothetical protein